MPALALMVTLPLLVAEVGVDEHTGERVPTDLQFVDTGGRSISLAEAMPGDRPVLLVLAYARCEQLCSVVLQGVAEAALAAEGELDLVPGRDYRLLLVGLDPHETHDEAARRQTALLERIGQPGHPERWPYLTGDDASIHALAAALGFRYAWDPASNQYAHPAVVFVLTPDARISRYLYGVRFPPRLLQAALTDARDGVIAPTPGAEALRCFRFEPGAVRFRDRLQQWFRAGAALVFVALCVLVGGLRLGEARRSRS